MSNRLHVRCLENKCHCAHHLPSVSCTVVTWALLPWTHRFTYSVWYQDKANRHWCDLFLLNNLLWNPTGGDITCKCMASVCIVMLVFSGMHPHLQRSCLLFLQLQCWWPFWTTIVLYWITSIHGQNSNIVFSSYYFYFFITCALITFHYRNQL